MWCATGMARLKRPPATPDTLPPARGFQGAATPSGMAKAVGSLVIGPAIRLILDGRYDSARHARSTSAKRIRHVRVVVTTRVNHQGTTRKIAYLDPPGDYRSGRCAVSGDHQSRQVSKMTVPLGSFVTPRIRRVIVPSRVFGQPCRSPGSHGRESHARQQ